ncbi:MAG: hypothetical protein PHH36_05255 [Sideroxydans sp.]|nr:hypothetical protein [Sideroxydans sp.]
MKKIALSLAGVMAAVAFAPEASAIPAFARQTGMACSACHAQHFPVLNGFGRAFKSAGFTMMGSQEKVEGEHLSIPSTLNAAVLLKVRYQKTNGPDGGELSGASTNTGQWQFPDEYSLFFGGRVADNGAVKVGMMMENNLKASMMAAGLRVPVVVETDSAKLSLIPFTTDSLGAFYGYTESSNALNRAIRWAENRTQVFAHQFSGIGDGAATGLAFVAHSDMGYINVSRFAPTFASATQMSSTAVHIAATPTIADFATVISAEVVSGESYVGTTVADKRATKGTGLSAQAHGELAGMETGLYFAYSVAAKSDAAVANQFNSSTTNDKKATQIGADFTVIPHTLSLGANYLAGKNGAGETENYFTVTGVYDLAQNVALVANYTIGSGSAFDAGASKDASVVGSEGKNLLTLMLESAW